MLHHDDHDDQDNHDHDDQHCDQIMGARLKDRLVEGGSKGAAAANNVPTTMIMIVIMMIIMMVIMMMLIMIDHNEHEYDDFIKTSQELRMLSSVTLNCQVTKIVKK